MYKLTGNDIPPQLREIPEPPAQLYLEGEIPEFDEYKYLTVVGSRRYSHYGEDVCQRIISELAGFHIVIVSGLALGIDAIAHRTALTAGLKTIGMPGSGLHPSVLAPKTNLQLAEEILRQGGALLSEFEPRLEAHPAMFPQRNRLMVGLSNAVLVIEAGERSGTLITARMAMEYNRDLYIVPGPIFSPHCEGSNRFMKEGATPILSGADLLHELGFCEKEKRQLDHEFTPQEQTIVNLLYEPKSRDVIMRESGMAPAACATLLMTMELKGIIRERMGEIQIV